MTVIETFDGLDIQGKTTELNSDKIDNYLMFLFGGGGFSPIEFENGGWAADGSASSYRTAVRARMVDYAQFPFDIKVIGAGGVPGNNACILIDSGGSTSLSSWSTNLTIPKDTKFKLVLDGYTGVSSGLPTLTTQEILQKYTIESSIDLDSMQTNIETLQSELSNDVPDYYHANNYIDNIVMDAQEKANSTSISFAFITDMHTGSSSKNSMRLMRYIYNRTTAVPFVVCGGDIPKSAIGTEEGLYQEVIAWQEMMAQYGKDRIYMCRGNHDYLGNLSDSTVYRSSFDMQKSYTLGNLPRNIHSAGEGSLAYYFDVEGYNTRFIVVDEYSVSCKPTFGGYIGISADDYYWLVDEAIPQEDMNVIVVAHQPLITADSTYVTTLNLLRDILAAFASHQRVQGNYGAAVIDKDFSNYTSNLVCVLSGHKHLDTSSDADGFLNIVTTSDALLQTDGYNRQPDSITECAFDIVSVDYVNKVIYCTRVGAGNDRQFSY